MTGFRITTITAFTTIGEDDEEGIVAWQIDGVWYPLIAADEVRLREYMPIVEAMRADGMTINRRVFTAVEQAGAHAVVAEEPWP